ncbi:MAG: LysR family transcriptional regulator [Hyphomicrobiales bacterium]|nr:MAG: LysR family transcriptional regulator [Hyphomicrobiales bacterium]
MRGLTLKQLRALQQVVQTGTITGAARALYVTPPAVTTQIRVLETAAGLPLIERVGDRFQPTEAGQALLDAAARIDASLDECGHIISALQGLSGGRVTVGVVSTAKYFAPHALGAFSRAHPDIDVRLIVGNRGEILSALETDAVDIAVMGRPPEGLEVERTVLGDHPHIIIAAPDHPLANRRSLALSDLADETFLVREPGSGTRMLMERRLAEADIQPQVGMEIGSNETIKQAVMAGLGIAFISAHTVAYELSDARLAELDVTGLPVVRQWFVVERKSKKMMPAAEALRDFVIKESARFLPDRPQRSAA